MGRVSNLATGAYPSRAALERRHGYDTKHAMHLIRLMRMGLEALERGALPFDELLAVAARLQGEMERAAATTRLPRDVDYAHVDELALELMAESGAGG